MNIYSSIGRTLSPESADALANMGATFKEWTDTGRTLLIPPRAWVLYHASGSLHAALNGSEQMYGEDHPMTGGILRALAGVCDAQGSTEDGRRYRERAEANRRKNLQAADADAASVLDRHGTALMGQGLYDETDAYLRQAVSIRENTLGEHDFDTSTSLLKLGVLLQLRRRDEEARQYLERTLDVRADICGQTHPATELVRENLRLVGG